MSDPAADGDRPSVERYTAPFWDALAEDRFLLHACRACAAVFFPPAPVCPDCGRTDVEWTDADGEGTLYAFTRQHTAPPGFEAPVVLGTVELAEGPRLLAPVEAAYDDLTIGQPVRLVAREYTAGYDRGDLADAPYFAAVPL